MFLEKVKFLSLWHFGIFSDEKLEMGTQNSYLLSISYVFKCCQVEDFHIGVAKIYVKLLFIILPELSSIPTVLAHMIQNL